MNLKKGYKQVLQIDRDEMKEYGEFFKSMRESIGLTLVDMAKVLQIGCRTSISRWEKGKCIPQKDIDLLVDRYREVVKKYKINITQSNL